MNNNDLELRLLRGSPVEIDGIGKLHPLTLDEISQIGELKYNQLLSAVIFNQQPLELEGKQLSKFETLMVYCFHDESFRKVFAEVLNILFKQEVHLHQGGFFYFGDLTEEKVITPEKYEQIVDIIKKQNYFKENEEEKDDYNPINEKARELIEKIKKYKKLIKEANAEDGLNLGDIISIVSSYSGNLNIFNVWDLTVYQLYTHYIRLMMRDNYETQFQLMLQGADIKSSDVKHWATKLNK